MVAQFNGNTPFSTVINLSHPHSLSMGEYWVMNPTKFILSGLEKTVHASVFVRLIGDDMHTPEFEGFSQHTKSFAYDKAMNAVNLVEFSWDGYEAYYRIYSPHELMNDSAVVIGSTLTGTTLSSDTSSIFSIAPEIKLGYVGPSSSFVDMTYAGYMSEAVFPPWTYVDEMYGVFFWNNGTRFGFQGRYEKNTPDRTDDTYNWLFGELTVPYDLSTITNLYDSALGTNAETTYNTNLDVDPEQTYLLNGRYEAGKISLTSFVLNPTTKRFQYSSRSYLFEGDMFQLQRMGGEATGTYWYDSGWKLLRANASEIFTVNNRETMTQPYRFIMRANDYPEITQEMYDAQLTRERTIPTFMPNTINVQFNGNGKKLTWATSGIGGRVWEISLATAYDISSYIGVPVDVTGITLPDNFELTQYHYDTKGSLWATVSGNLVNPDGSKNGRTYMFEITEGTFAGLTL